MYAQIVSTYTHNVLALILSHRSRSQLVSACIIENSGMGLKTRLCHIIVQYTCNSKI